MFGGAALYLDDAMFAMIVGNQLFMKSDSDLSNEYANAGSRNFTYGTKIGVRSIPGLMSLPEDALDDPDLALEWARRSLVPARIARDAKNAK